MKTESKEKSKDFQIIIPPGNWATEVGKALGISRITVWRDLKLGQGERYERIIDELEKLAREKGRKI